MKTRLFIFVVALQIVVIIFLFFQIKQRSGKTLGVSVNTINSKTIIKTPSRGLKYFYEPKPNAVEEVHKDWLFNVPKYTINSDSLNERFNYPIKKPPDTFRIITLGDSFTFGENVSTIDNWTELLENELNKNYTCDKTKKYEVINLGVEGYDTQYEVERYRLRGQKYSPDLLLWYIIELERITEKILPILSKTNESELEKKGIFFTNWKNAIDTIKKEMGEDGLIVFQTDLMNSIQKIYSGPIVFMGKYEFKLKQRLYGDDLYVVDPNPDWTNNENYLADGHPSEAGHINIAKKMIEYLTTHNLIPCSP